MSGTKKFTFVEFFAGGGMARAGLGQNWSCILANDIDPVKASAYRKNWGSEFFFEGDIAALDMTICKDSPDLVWASFPCQDLSLAGKGAGLKGERSGLFWTLVKHLNDMQSLGYKPRSIVLENVCGLLTSHGGEDFATIIRSISQLGYYIGALVIDAIEFLPQSRPRLFFIAVDKCQPLPRNCVSSTEAGMWGSSRIGAIASHKENMICPTWVWWRLPQPPKRRFDLIDIVERLPTGVAWHSPSQTQKLLQQMSENNLAKVIRAQLSGSLQIGTIYRRTRTSKDGVKMQRAEVRFDGHAGCLRTPAGGSSRQILILVEGESIRTRLLSPREAARLMGLPDNYIMPDRYNDAYHLAGDGVAVPVVRHIAHYILEPILGHFYMRHLPSELVR